MPWQKSMRKGKEKRGFLEGDVIVGQGKAEKSSEPVGCELTALLESKKCCGGAAQCSRRPQYLLQ